MSLNSNTFCRLGDATTFVILFYFFPSLTTDMDPASKRPRVPEAQPGMVYNAPRVSLFYFCFWLSFNPFSSPSLLPCGKVTNGKCGSSFRVVYKASSTSNKLLYSFSYGKMAQSLGDTAGYYFCIPWLLCLFFSAATGAVEAPQQNSRQPEYPLLGK